MKYLNEKTVTEPDAIERLFCIPFSKLKRYPMDKETTEVLIQLMMVKGALRTDLKDKDKPFIMRMIESRSRAYTYTMDQALHVFLSVLTRSPGMAVMYMVYLQYWSHTNKVTDITLDIFCNIFPMGFPLEKDLSALWDATKVHTESRASDNLIDYRTAMQSIY